MTNQLNRCPLCRSKDVGGTNDNSRHAIECKSCGFVAVFPGSNITQAMDSWNKITRYCDSDEPTDEPKTEMTPADEYRAVRGALIEAVAMLTSCMLIVTDDQARALGLECIKQMRAVLADTQP